MHFYCSVFWPECSNKGFDLRKQKGVRTKHKHNILAVFDIKREGKTLLLFFCYSLAYINNISYKISYGVSSTSNG